MMVRSILILVAALQSVVFSAEVVVVVGASGTQEFGEVFGKSADSWEAAAKEGEAALTVIGRDQPGEITDLGRLEEKLTSLAKEESATPLWIVLIGHGTFDGRQAKFNLRGEDLNAEMLGKWLKGSKRPTAVINTSASSSPFIKTLSAKNRIVMTATKSGFEDSYARFGQFLASSINSPDADIDQDGATSLLEAFLSATKQVQEFYEKEGRIVTEQALVDDNGDGLGTPASWFRGTRAVKSAKDGAEPDGLRARQWHLVPSEAERNLPEALREQRDDLEEQLFALRARKESMDEDKYFEQLEQIARKLAELYQRAVKESQLPEPDS